MIKFLSGNRLYRFTFSQSASFKPDKHAKISFFHTVQNSPNIQCHINHAAQKWPLNNQGINKSRRAKVRFEVIMTVSREIAVSWDVTPFSSVEAVYLSFRGPYCFHYLLYRDMPLSSYEELTGSHKGCPDSRKVFSFKIGIPQKSEKLKNVVLKHKFISSSKPMLLSFWRTV